jgi:hypothetical protein
MSTRSLISLAGRALVGGVCLLASASCGSEMLRTGRSPVYLMIAGVSIGDDNSAFLMSDVLIEGGVVNDPVVVTFRSVLKNPQLGSDVIQTVTLTRYHVEFRRTDGRNTPGVDVPYGFDGGISALIPPGESGNAAFVLVRHQAKLEPPLMQLRFQGGQALISTIAEITFFGHDQNGNEVSVVGRIDVHFGDFADP